MQVSIQILYANHLIDVQNTQLRKFLPVSGIPLEFACAPITDHFNLQGSAKNMHIHTACQTVCEWMEIFAKNLQNAEQQRLL